MLIKSEIPLWFTAGFFVLCHPPVSLLFCWVIHFFVSILNTNHVSPLPVFEVFEWRWWEQNHPMHKFYQWSNMSYTHTLYSCPPSLKQWQCFDYSNITAILTQLKVLHEVMVPQATVLLSTVVTFILLKHTTANTCESAGAYSSQSIFLR